MAGGASKSTVEMTRSVATPEIREPAIVVFEALADHGGQQLAHPCDHIGKVPAVQDR